MESRTWYKCVESFSAYGGDYVEGEDYANLSEDLLLDYEGHFEEWKEEIENDESSLNPFD